MRNNNKLERIEQDCRVRKQGGSERKNERALKRDRMGERQRNALGATVMITHSLCVNSSVSSRMVVGAIRSQGCDHDDDDESVRRCRRFHCHNGERRLPERRADIHGRPAQTLPQGRVPLGAALRHRARCRSGKSVPSRDTMCRRTELGPPL